MPVCHDGSSEKDMFIMHRIARMTLGVGLMALLVLVSPLTAFAHEQRDIANGTYHLVVGFLNEPAFVDQQNGLSLRVSKLDAAPATPAASDEDAVGTPVEGVADSLKVEVIFGDQKMELPLEPEFRDPGAYRAIFFPTAEGDYTFHIFGDIEGTAVDETFTSSPEGFSSVESIEPLRFPKKASFRSGDGVVVGTLTGGAGSDGGGPGLPGGSVLAAAGVAVAAGLWLWRRRLAGYGRPSFTPRTARF